MNTKHRIIAFFSVIFLWVIPIKAQVRFWIKQDSIEGNKKIRIHTSGFINIKTIGFELRVDTLMIPPGILKEVDIQFISFKNNYTFVQKKRNAIRVFAFSHGSEPLLSSEDDAIVDLIFPTDASFIDLRAFKFSKWSSILIDQNFELMPTQASPSQEIHDPSSGNFSSKFTIFPNPSKDQFWIRANFINLRECKILLYDVLGRMVYRKRNLNSILFGNDENIDIKDLAQGVYFLRIQFIDIDGTKKTETKRLLKIK